MTQQSCCRNNNVSLISMWIMHSKTKTKRQWMIGSSSQQEHNSDGWGPSLLLTSGSDQLLLRSATTVLQSTSCSQLSAGHRLRQLMAARWDHRAHTHTDTQGAGVHKHPVRCVTGASTAGEAMSRSYLSWPCDATCCFYFRKKKDTGGDPRSSKGETWTAGLQS